MARGIRNSAQIKTHKIPISPDSSPLLLNPLGGTMHRRQHIGKLRDEFSEDDDDFSDNGSKKLRIGPPSKAVMRTTGVTLMAVAAVVGVFLFVGGDSLLFGDHSHWDVHVKAAKHSCERAGDILDGRWNPGSFNTQFNVVGAVELLLYAVRNALVAHRMLPLEAATRVELRAPLRSLRDTERELLKVMSTYLTGADESLMRAHGREAVVTLGEHITALTQERPSTSRFFGGLPRFEQRTQDRIDVWIDSEHFLVYDAHLRHNYNLKNGTVTLSNGVVMPLVGLGTWQLNGQRCIATVQSALSNGYRRFDTAAGYNNEAEVGEAIALSGIARSDVFIATKISADDFGRERTLTRFHKQLANLQTDYVDLYMLHGAGSNDADTRERRMQTWAVLEELYNEGKIRALGVSNHDGWWMRNLLQHSVRNVRPHVVQNKHDVFHPGLQLATRPAEAVHDILREHNIVLEAYSPLSGWPWASRVVHDPHVRRIAHRYRREPSQIVLRWALQRTVAVLPRSSNTLHQRQNLALFDFDLADRDLALLDGLTWMVASPLYVPLLDAKSNIFDVDLRLLDELKAGTQH